MALVYHFCNRKFGLENIRERRLKIATINDLNDPFEMSCYSSGDKDVRRHIGQAKEFAHKTYGLLCFSRSFSSAVQWGHYAEKHKGLCLGFEVPDHMLHKIAYQTNRQGFDLLSYSYMARLQRRSYLMEQLTIKHSHWRYEQESRLIFNLDEDEKEGQFYFKSFSGIGELKQVIIGCASEITRKEISDNLGSEFSHVERFKARPAFRRYLIVKNKNEKLWI